VIGDTWPPHYERLPFPTFGGFHGEWRLSWNGVVADRARILDPMFHGGNTEAIRLRIWVEEDHPLVRTRVPRGVGEWIEFRNFKDANAYVQMIKRLDK
jgi:hypothetical protein